MCFHGPDLNFIVIGLDNAGKSTIINQLKPQICQSTKIDPTDGISNPWIPFHEFRIRFRDMSGTNNSRPLWQQYADNLNGIIFVIDSSDNIRFSTAADELHAFLDLPPIKEKPIPLLVFANKNDIQGSAPVEVIQRELRLENYTAHPTLVKGVCSHFPKEIFSGLEWIVKRHV